jgi:hypothetical protein
MLKLADNALDDLKANNHSKKKNPTKVKPPLNPITTEKGERKKGIQMNWTTGASHFSKLSGLG